MRIAPSNIDEDGMMADRFSNVLATVKRIHKRWRHESAGAEHQERKMVAAAAMLVAVCDEYDRAVCQLAWAVAEHDATHAPRLSGVCSRSAGTSLCYCYCIAFG